MVSKGENMSGFSGKQAKCIEYLAVGEMAQVDIAKEIKVNPSTISKWKKDQAFMEAVLERSRVLLKESLPQVYRSLGTHAKAGNDRHIKIYLDHLEKLEDIRAGKASITFTWLPPTDTKETTDE